MRTIYNSKNNDIIKDDLYYDKLAKDKIKNLKLFKKDLLQDFDEKLRIEIIDFIEKQQSKNIERGYYQFDRSIYWMLTDYDYAIEGYRCDYFIKKIIEKSTIQSSEYYYDFKELSKTEVALHLKKNYKKVLDKAFNYYETYYNLNDKEIIKELTKEKQAENQKRFNDSLNNTIKENRKKEIKQAIKKNAKKSLGIFAAITLFFTSFLNNLDKKLHKK